MSTILKQYKDLLDRQVSGIVHFNDVFAENPVDIDSELTAIIRNLGNFSDLRFPIGNNPKLADYGVNLLNDLIEEQRRILKIVQDMSGKNIDHHFSNKAVLAIVNKADRNSKTTAEGKNGEDFHLAITDNGLEIYAVPLARLQALETRNKILALYRIPNEKLVVTDGRHEQFRSSIIATTRHFPNILEPVFEYFTKEDLIRAKENGTHPNVIPEQKYLAEFAFSDKFGNVRVSVRNNKEFKKYFDSYKIGDVVKIKVNGSEPVNAFYVTSLKEIPVGEVGIYQNIADVATEGAGYWEIVKKSEDCNHEKETATAILEHINPNFRDEDISIL
ncbi:hypothetical protein KKD70_00355 [Patescibacteria group bacterium]|nr:hypothetical protein [Patescibacteria group bacterium]